MLDRRHRKAARHQLGDQRRHQRRLAAAAPAGEAEDAHRRPSSLSWGAQGRAASSRLARHAARRGARRLGPRHMRQAGPQVVVAGHQVSIAATHSSISPIATTGNAARARHRRRSARRSRPSGSPSSTSRAATPACRRAARRGIRAAPRPGSRGTGSPAPATPRGRQPAGRGQHEQGRRDQQLVGDRVEKAAELGLLLPAPRHVPVEPVGDTRPRRTARSRTSARNRPTHRTSRPPPGSPGCATGSADWAGWSAAHIASGAKSGRDRRSSYPSA